MNAVERRCKSVERRSNPLFAIQSRFIIPERGNIPQISRSVHNRTGQFSSTYNSITINNIATPLNGLLTPSNAVQRH